MTNQLVFFVVNIRTCVLYEMFMHDILPDPKNYRAYSLRPRRHEHLLAIKDDARNCLERQLLISPLSLLCY